MGFASSPVARPEHVPADRVVDFDIYNLPPAADPHSAWKLLQAPDAPDVVWTPRNGGHWIMARGKVISDAFADYEAFSSRIKLVPKEVGEQYRFVPSTVDPPVHRPYRLLLNSSLSPQAVKALEPRVERLADALIDDFIGDGACNFTTQYAQHLPIQIFLEMCDLPAEDGQKLKAFADQITRPDGSMTVMEAVGHLRDYLSGPVAARIRQPGDDVLSRIVTGQVDGKSLTLEQALDTAPQVLIAGLDTVVNFLSFVLLFLARNLAHRRELAARPELIPGAVNELLRRYPLVVAARVIPRDLTFAGVDFREGDMVVLPSLLHGLDERENPDPLTVDFHRSGGQHVTFGRGHHHCPGSYLARAEVRITLEAWLRRIPDFEIAPGADIVFRGGVVPTINALPLVWTRPA